MTEQVLSLTTFYKGWGGYQQGLVNIIAPLTTEQLALPVAPHRWSLGMIAQHIIANRVWWFHGWMGEGSPDLMAIAHWDPGYDEAQPLRAATELVAGLEITWQIIADALARWTPADLGRRFPPAAFLSVEEQRNSGERTRQWIIWHVLEHEIHHGGELSLGLGAYGLAGIYGSM
ncbi:MAG: DinB family protein [Chloroflexota bacterium]|nr:DinB family protein [Chloroflexota bacterium]